jgi:hypothetical protein
MAEELMLPLGIIDNEPGFEDIDRMQVEHHTSFMTQADEPSLLAMASNPQNHVYRFYWTRHLYLFGPILIRVTIQNDGTALAVVKIWRKVRVNDPIREYGEYEDELSTALQKKLNKRQVKRFLFQLEKANFWHLPTWDKRIGCDGESWELEGVKAGQFHFVTRWVPQDQTYIDIGLLLLRFCKLRRWAWELGGITRKWDKRLSENILNLFVWLIIKIRYRNLKTKY